MSIGAGTVLGKLLDHAKVLGVFTVARLTEFKSAPPPGLCFALWVERLGASPVGSGLASTNAIMPCKARIYLPMLYKPESDIEVKVTDAADAYLGRLNGAFTLGGTVRNVDLLGEAGDAPMWIYGYANIDNQLYRIADLSMSIVFNDSWAQTA